MFHASADLNRSQSTNILDALLLNPAFVTCILMAMLATILSRFAMEVDTGIWNYISRMWLYHGIPPYTGSVENKTPGIFYIFLISNWLFGLNLWFPRFIALASMLATGLMLYFIGKRICNKTCGQIALTLFGLACCQEGIIGFAATTEMFMVLFSTSAILCVAYSSHIQSYRNYRVLVFICGFLMGCAISFKQIALLDTAAVFLFYLSLPERLSSRFKKPIRDSLFFGTGVFISMACFTIPILIGGTHFEDFWECAWQMLPHSGRFIKLKRVTSFFHEFFQPELKILYALFFIFCTQAKTICGKKIPFWSVAYWTVIDIIAINAAGTYFHHHFLQLMPSITISAAILLTLFIESSLFHNTIRRKKTAQLLLACFLVLAPYREMIDFFLEKPQTYEHPSLIGLKELGIWLKEHTSPDDRIFVFSKPAGILMTYSERRSPSRHFTRMFSHVEYIIEETVNDLSKNLPKYIIFKPARTENATWFLDFLKPRYTYVDTFYGYDVYILTKNN